MIKVKYTDKMITIAGHANFADFGTDIVCASASSIITTSVNNMLALDKESIVYSDNGKQIVIEMVKDNQYVTIIFNNLIDLLKDLASDYHKNIKVESEE
ncbi:MAG: ribosomal-processing cysteine protease Prp [Bacilli bacterium]|nr:ribosomal-processing cysteine protease Prp [Bacilli bacterium]MDD4795634.1 ribosomal-processing cysteine protease Prp [Bacilli bacterium]